MQPSIQPEAKARRINIALISTAHPTQTLKASYAFLLLRRSNVTALFYLLHLASDKTPFVTVHPLQGAALILSS